MLRLQRSLTYQHIGAAALATWACSPSSSLLVVVALIALVSSKLKKAISTNSPTQLFPLILSLLAGQALAFLLVSKGTVHHLPLSNSLSALLLASLAATLPPICGFLLAETLLHRFSSSSASSRSRATVRGSWREIAVPAMGFALAGMVQETTSGVGRTVWWIRGGGELDWLRSSAGPLGVDVVVAVAGVALGVWVEESLRSDKEVDLMEHGDQGEEQPLLGGRGDVEVRHGAGALVRKATRSSTAIKIIFIIGALALISPSLPSTFRLRRLHPSIDSPAFVYPPLKVGCVAPPRHERRTTTTLEDYLHETRVVAGRGAKVVSWPEGAVRLDKGAGSGEAGKDGWEGLGREEKELLSKVGEVSDASGAFILATYLVPASTSTHKLNNVATLIGPSIDHEHPNILFSTTKHLPVPFIEGFPLTPRRSSELCSSPSALPITRITLPHGPKTPAPNRTPLQQLHLSAAICLDVASPSLFTHYTSSSAQTHPDSVHYPSLILNPSSLPLDSSYLIAQQLSQASSRALETGSFILRCDSAGGASALLGPDGEARVLRRGEEAWTSWEMTADVERARRTVWSWWGGKVWLGGEWGVWLMLAVMMSLGEVDWRLVGLRMREWPEALGSAMRRTRAREGQGPEQGRLVEVD